MTELEKYKLLYEQEKLIIAKLEAENKELKANLAMGKIFNIPGLNNYMAENLGVV